MGKRDWSIFLGQSIWQVTYLCQPQTTLNAYQLLSEYVGGIKWYPGLAMIPALFCLTEVPLLVLNFFRRTHARMEIPFRSKYTKVKRINPKNATNQRIGSFQTNIRQF